MRSITLTAAAIVCEVPRGKGHSEMFPSTLDFKGRGITPIGTVYPSRLGSKFLTA